LNNIVVSLEIIDLRELSYLFNGFIVGGKGSMDSMDKYGVSHEQQLPEGKGVEGEQFSTHQDTPPFQGK
jgi:hypothetical protein